MNLAVDSLPLSSDVYRTMDYSGLQISGLQHIPLHRAAHSICGNGTTWQIELKPVQWDDGQALRPAEYVEGLLRLIAAQPVLRAYLQSRIKRITTRGEKINFEFNSLVGPNVFEWPNWMPFREGHFSGAVLKKDSATSWTWNSREGRGGKIRLVSSPHENEELFQSGVTDFTCDTAIPLNKVDESVNRRDTGLFGALIFTNSIRPDKIKALQSALNGLVFSPHIENAYPSLRSTMATSTAEAPQTIDLCYDAFYPNHDVCIEIAEHLSLSGWKVNLSVDNYYQPSLPGDVKFMILRRPVRNATVSAIWMNLMPRSSQVRQKIRDQVTLCESGANFEWHALAEAELAIPLFQIPSLYRARWEMQNPLLELFA